MKNIAARRGRNVIGSRIREARLRLTPEVSQFDLAGRIATQGLDMDRPTITRLSPTVPATLAAFKLPFIQSPSKPLMATPRKVADIKKRMGINLKAITLLSLATHTSGLLMPPIKEFPMTYEQFAGIDRDKLAAAFRSAGATALPGGPILEIGKLKSREIMPPFFKRPDSRLLKLKIWRIRLMSNGFRPLRSDQPEFIPATRNSQMTD